MTILVFALLCSVAAAGHPGWPLDIPTRYVTGNFMEPRDGRYHAGLDLKTHSRTGYPVLAVEDGHISRLRISAGGYGKAVYLTADTGMTYVYGHLERLRDDLREEAVRRQHELGSYEIDLWFQPQRWPVARGAVLALSGQTATLGPHLHFEVRGPDGQPLDPLAHGFAVPDRIAPQILAVRAVRSGDFDPPSLLLSGDGPLGGRLPELNIEEGTLHFSALIVERSDRQNHMLGPWRVRLLVDGHEVFAVMNDSLRWDNAHHQRLEFHGTALGQEQWLRVDRRNRLAGRRAADWLTDGRWPAGRHDIQLMAEDRAGNRSEVSWTLTIGASGGSIDDLDSAPKTEESILAWRPDVDVLRDPWLVDVDDADLACGTVPEGGLAWAAAPLRDLLPRRFWHVSGLEPAGLPVQFRLEDDWALVRSVSVAWPAEAMPTTLDLTDPAIGIYRLNRHAWKYAGLLRSVCGVPTLELTRPGVYQVMYDRSPPIIAKSAVEAELTRRPMRRRGGITLPSWPLVKIPVGDHGSGVDWDSLETHLDGQRIIAEPDPPRDRVLVELPDSLENGRHRLHVSVRDRAGNTARAELILTLLEARAEEEGEATQGG